MHDLLDIDLRSRLAMAIGAVLVALTLAVALPGHAVAAGCTPDDVRLSVSKSGSTIYGYGGFYSCSTRPNATIMLERYRGWLVGWRPLTSKYGAFSPNSAVRLSYNCAGTGTYSYRVRMNGRRIDGSYWWRESNVLRVDC